MFCIYQTATGELVSTTDSLALIASPLPGGLSVIEVANPASGWVWNPGTLNFIAPPSPRIISKTEFIERFTLAEKKELFGFMYGSSFTAAQQKNLASIMRYMDFIDSVNLDSTDIQTGVNYFVTVNILTAARRDAVLA